MGWHPIGGVGINLAIQDAVWRATYLGENCEASIWRVKRCRRSSEEGRFPLAQPKELSFSYKTM